VAFYSDRVRMCEHFEPNSDYKNWLLHHDKAPSDISFFTTEFLTKNNMTVVSHPTLLFSLSPIEDKTE
jgi:hypothetical protein